jgi:hypothetical protein
MKTFLARFVKVGEGSRANLIVATLHQFCFIHEILLHSRPKRVTVPLFSRETL